VEKLNSLPAAILLGGEAVSFNLTQAMQRPDVPMDVKSNLEKCREALAMFIEHAREAQREIDPTCRWE
jgi:hypothetical protein